MAKKSRNPAADGQRLVRRLRAAHDQLRDHSARARQAADAVERVMRQLEAQLGAADGARATPPGRGVGRGRHPSHSAAHPSP